jgi:hypothetical protein
MSTTRWMISAGLALLATAALSTDALAATGRTPGSFAVSPTGAATYTIPIWAPPGPQGVQPQISLSYSSSGGSGPEGIGWFLSGLSSIARCNQTVAQDGTALAVSLSYTDRFCLDGKHLRITNNTLANYGLPNTTYQTEVADFSNVTASAATAGNGPAFFTVQARNGWTFEYGATTDSLVLADGHTASAWMLDKVTDRASNTMTITWKSAGPNLAGTTVPDTISWTPNNHGSNTYVYKMLFTYQTLTTAVQAGYVAGTPIQDNYLLSNIAIQSSGATIKAYLLDYTPSTTTGQETLTTVTECTDTARLSCLQPTTMAYQPGQTGIPSSASTISRIRLSDRGLVHRRV